MKILAFLLCLTVGVSFALRCDHSKCKDSDPLKDLQEIHFMPSAQQLGEYCPKMLRFLDCNIDVLEKCTGKTINELASSSDESVAEATTSLLEGGSLVRDVCNPQSTLHKDYVAHIDCFRGFIFNGASLCDDEAKEALEDFFAKTGIERGGLDETLNNEMRCLEVAYGVTCTTIRLGESCGESARNAFISVLRRLKSLLDRECEIGPDSLKNKYLQYIEVEDEQRSKIQETFDLIGRRR